MLTAMFGTPLFPVTARSLWLGAGVVSRAACHHAVSRLLQLHVDVHSTLHASTTTLTLTLTFMWMFGEGLYLHTLIVCAFTSGNKLLTACYAIGWGQPTAHCNPLSLTYLLTPVQFIALTAALQRSVKQQAGVCPTVCLSLLCRPASSKR